MEIVQIKLYVYIQVIEKGRRFVALNQINK